MKKSFICLLLVFVMAMATMPIATVSAASAPVVGGMGASLLSTLNNPPSGVNTDIQNLQYLLTNLGHAPVGGCDGKWGTNTKNAVIAFQQDYPSYLSPDGVVGAKTATALVQAALQKRFAFKYLSVDGVWGHVTGSAVCTLQMMFSLTADGVVGSATWAKLCTSSKNYTPNWYIKIVLSSDRTTGTLYAYNSSGTQLHSCKCLGYSYATTDHTNNWKAVNMDTPLGVFRASIAAASSSTYASLGLTPPSFGFNTSGTKINTAAVSSDLAYGAYQIIKMQDDDIKPVTNNRTGVWIHSTGAANKYTTTLYPTHGCVKIFSSDQSVLASKLSGAGFVFITQ